ncbi:beta-ketoacyl-ACP synthase III [Kutzneria chonburiensis]|uniref:Beta-ketoacyl-[acyl-carrier-protein] synthase III n=1 Tax=Kutzneria chonburiensis TaxID=1483604 RepID=A0ABV6N6Z7_9PSEU|nr:beta-ketoacyl-ACP synthase III [Kutzneria chonburiensis]
MRELVSVEHAGGGLTTRSVGEQRVAVVAGIAGHVPEQVLTNGDLITRFDTSDEWIRSRTGIGERRVARPGEATSDLAVQAGSAALASVAAIEPIDLVILATSTPDHPCPATAPAVAARLGLKGVAAFDVGAVCSGFVYGLAVAQGMIAGGVVKSALLIGADVFSTILNPADRSTNAVFGDGAGAMVLRAGESDELGAVHAIDLGSDGDLADLITVRAGGSREPTAEHGADRWFSMQGQAVYRHAVLRMTESSRKVLAAKGWRPDDVDRLVAHQANARILATVGAELGVAPNRVYSNISTVGNTVAASIPLALADAHAQGQLAAGDRLLLTAFGGGATWGSVTLTWPHLR